MWGVGWRWLLELGLFIRSYTVSAGALIELTFLMLCIFQCEPISGFGFRRGGYQCVCLPGYYYPWWHDGPFQGWEIEQATDDEYEFGFDCIQAESKSYVVITKSSKFRLL